MPADKFYAIEVSDGVAPMQLYCAATPGFHGGAVHIALLPRPASWKPRDRWLGEESRKAAVCCAPSAQGIGCCA